DLPADVDGVPTTPTSDPAPIALEHPNGVSRLDHVVFITPDLDRTMGALEAVGFEARRTRDVPGTDPVRRQVFVWAGESILEVVGTVEPTGDGPADLWGLALTSSDLDGAASLLGDRISTPKDAVQPGRRIATIDTRTLGIGTALALMTPHVR
ncbi:MAG: glyoxalase, partial [Actinomycetota bacterium]